MTIVNTGDTYEVYGDALKTHDTLPAGMYKLRFAQSRGFFLQKQQDASAVTERLYGDVRAKAMKALKTFPIFGRSLGVLLSGDKGMGKTLCARVLAAEAMKIGLPVIMVDLYTPGIASFLESIRQEVMVMLDEFDKVFYADGDDPQDELLALFDGMTSEKKLFVATCNSLYRLNDCFLSRPGRFHYHFRFDYPNGTEIATYLQDIVDKQFWGEIEKIVAFASKVSLNYDCLRAIAFELNEGERFEDVVKYINIVRDEDEPPTYHATLHCSDGSVLRSNTNRLDLFNHGKKISITLYTNSFVPIADITFHPSAVVYDSVLHQAVIHPDKFIVEYANHSSQELEALKNTTPEKLVLTPDRPPIHYTV